MPVRTLTTLLLAIVVLACFAAPALAQETCRRFGPQAPRDISQHDGTNPVVFSLAPSADKLRLCDLHFHKHAEHRGPGFETPAGSGEFGGFRCDGSAPEEGAEAAEAEATDAESQVCRNVSPGDTIEAHWVYTTCDVDPAPTLDSCLSKSCGNPQLRVETQVFRVTRGAGVDFGAFTPTGEDTVTYLGSTTGDKLSATTCSPLQVTFSVPHGCMNVNIDSLAGWCARNPFNEHYAHGVRPLVTQMELLSKIP
jgi:hypothetical protein